MPAIRTVQTKEGTSHTSRTAPRQSTRPRNRVPSYAVAFPSLDVSDAVSANERPHSGRATTLHSLRRRSSDTMSSTTISGSKLPSLERDTSPESWNGRIEIDGVELRTTVAFDTFWRFAAERKAMDDKRRAGLPAPWTGDKILQEWFFCNTFRVLDKGCQFLIKEVIEKGPQDAQEIVFRVILFNLFTRIETWQLLDKALGPLTWATYDQEKYIEVLQDAFRRQIPLYTPGFIKPAPKWEPRPNYVNHLLFLESLMSTEVDTRLPVASYMADAFEYFFSMESLGPFSAYQLLLNLSYSKVLNFHPNDFVMSGPGSLSGLRKIFGKSWKSSNKEYGFHESVMRYMVDSQAFHFRRLGLEFSGLGPKKLPMDIADIEHTLCEVDKYCRIKHPEIKSGRTNVTRRFNAAPNTPAVNPAVLPKAWSHRARRTPKIRPTPVSPDKDKRYLIDFIRNHKVEDGETFYRVHWLGYPDCDDTWEAEDILMHDAPAAVQYYLDEIN